MPYKSRIDSCLLLVVLGLPTGLLSWVVFRGISGLVEVFIVIAVFGATIILPCWLLMATDYRFGNGNLYIRSGPFNWTVPLSEVKRIERSRSLASGPALSLDRLLIHYGNHKWILISPKDMDGFLAELESRRKTGST